VRERRFGRRALEDAADHGRPQQRRSIAAPADVNDALGFPRPVGASIDDGEFHENPDPRGPCGAKVADVSYAGASGRSFRSGEGAAIELILPATQALSEAVVLQRADLHDGCSGYASTTDTGTTQHVDGITRIEVGNVDTRAMAYAATSRFEGRATRGSPSSLSRRGTAG
jgi:hypothetical protein